MNSIEHRIEQTIKEYRPDLIFRFQQVKEKNIDSLNIGVFLLDVGLLTPSLLDSVLTIEKKLCFGMLMDGVDEALLKLEGDIEPKDETAYRIIGVLEKYIRDGVIYAENSVEDLVDDAADEIIGAIIKSAPEREVPTIKVTGHATISG